MIAIDLVSLIEQHSGVRLGQQAMSHKDGPEYAGPCPFCGGQDRFRVWPQAQKPHYWCRVCGSYGDHIQFLREHDGLSFADACQELGIDPSDLVSNWQEKPTRERTDPPPPERWQESARAFIQRATHHLWNAAFPESIQALAYLRGRGFSDDTIRRARLGYCPLMADGRWYMATFEEWGIDPGQLRDDQRAKGSVRIPDGIIIPWFEGSTIWKIAVKRPGQKLDYGQVLGSGEGMYNVDSIAYGKPVMMVEGEFDCLSVQQEAGDLVAVVATGSTTRGRSMRWLADLALAPCVLQSFDEDRAGDQGAEYWLETLKDATRWSPAFWKDANEMLQAQLAGAVDATLRQWVEYGITAAQPQRALAASVEQIEQEEPLVELEEEWEDEPPKGLYEYAVTISRIVDVLGGPGQVTIAKHEPGLTLEQYARQSLRPAYTPVSLPALPRRQCPHRVFSPETGPCKGVPLAHGWCVVHARSYELLCLGAVLGFPAVELTPRGIAEGAAQWEAYAECAPDRWLVRDIARIRRQFDYLSPFRLFSMPAESNNVLVPSQQGMFGM